MHSKAHILDLVCCSGLNPLNCTADKLPFTDHVLISFHVTLTLFKTKVSHVISYRKIKEINLDTFCSFSDHPSCPNNVTTDNLVSFYNDSLLGLLDMLAPLKTQTMAFTNSAPWFTPTLHHLKAKGRQLERLYKKMWACCAQTNV